MCIRDRHDYRTLLKQTQELKEGNFQAELPQDVGIFNALKDEFSEIRVGFEKAVQEETKSQNMKTELISNVSHDLKTPLTGIRNYVELLQQEGISETQRKEYVSMLDQYAKRLHALMEDLFEVSKANSGNIQLDMARLDIIALVEQVQACLLYTSACLQEGLDMIFVENRSLYALMKGTEGVYPRMPRVMKEEYPASLMMIQETGGLQAGEVFCDTSLNMTNSHTAAFLLTHGARGISFSCLLYTSMCIRDSFSAASV